MPANPFHLAIAVSDIAAARAFYGGLLQCPEGRSDRRWVDFDLYGHQLVAHHIAAPTNPLQHNPVDGDDVPVPHFGVVLERADWTELARRLQRAGIAFIVEPHVRFEGQIGEQATMFFLDPFGNALEFKSFRDPAQLFAK